MINTLILYVVVEIWALIFMYIAEKKKDLKIIIGKNKISASIFLMAISIMPLLILIIFRDTSVGTDYLTHINTYKELANNNLTEQQNSWWGIGFKTLANIFIFFFENNYRVFFSFIGVITLILIYNEIWKNSKKPVFSLFIYFSLCLYYQIFNQMRQMLAISVVFYALRFIRNKNIWKYVFCIIIASTLHNTAIIALPIGILPYIKLTKKTYIFYGIIMVIIWFLYSKIVSILGGTYYGSVYFDNLQYDISFKMSTILNLLLRIMMMVTCIFFYNKNKKNDIIAQKKKDLDDDFNTTLIQMTIICTIIQLLAIKSYIFARLTTYYFIAYIILIPNIFENMKSAWRKIILIGTIIFFGAYHVFYFTSENGKESGYQEYKFLSIGEEKYD